MIRQSTFKAGYYHLLPIGMAGGIEVECACLSPEEIRRRYPRMEWTGPVVVVARRGVFRGQAANLSEGGIAVALRQPVKDISVSIELPSIAATTLLLRAVRRHQSEGLYGFEFTSLTPTQSGLLRRLSNTANA